MSSTVGFDAKEFHSGVEKDFFAIMGAGIEISDHNNFKNKYDKIMDKLWNEVDYPRKRKVYKARHIDTLLEDDAPDFKEHFVSEIKKHIIHTNIFFTIISPRKIPKIFTYGRKRVLDPIDFMRINQNSYVSWCGWKYIQEKKPSDCLFLLDNFQGEHTLAWESLSKKNPRIYFRGDNCNALISTSDIIIDAIDKKCRITKRLNNAKIQSGLDELDLGGSVMFIGQPDLHFITPVSKNPIDTKKYLVHPIYAIISEERPELLTKKEWEENRSYSKVVDVAVNLAFENNGSVKWFDPGYDFKVLNENDTLIYYGKKGQQLVESVGKAYDINIHHFSSSKDKHK